ncbi:synaptic vesicle 2-related protein-like [Cyclopterus lumpus]|uniref:synaptic vesicle 2-related protein-like n=1 Tax=Cyclopterus lumpus TaxID=8103 RepID=UPI001486BFCD|nr:synaptic vesicle 2-related protein-like [Cyclopterus lumpus]
MESWSRIPTMKYRRWTNPGASGDRSDEDYTDNEICVIASARVDPEGIKSASRTGFHQTEETFTVDDALEAFGFGKFQWKMSVLTGLSWIGDAMEMMILSILGPQLHCEWRLPSYQVALITSVVFVGMAIGSTVLGNVSDIYGRKAGLKISMFWVLFYGLLSAFAPVYGWLLILRGLVGFGLGGAPQSVTLYSEFLPVKSRGFSVILLAVFWALGSVFTVLLALVTMPTLGWRWLLGLSTIPMAITICLFSWLPESPRFHVLTGKTDKAMATFARIAKENGKAMPQGKLVIYKQAGHRPIKTLFTSRYWRTTLLLWCIWFAYAFTYYGIVLLTTELYQAGHSCEGTQGGKIEPSCRLECKYLTIADYKDLLWTTTAEFPGILVILLVIDRIGRKKSLALCFFMFSLSMLPIYACIGRTAVTICIFIARAFISGGYQVAYVYTSEVFPTEIRALAIGTSGTMSKVGALVTPFVAQVLLRTSVYGTLSLYCAFSLLGGIASLILPIETVGKGLQESSLDKDSGDETTTRTSKSNDTAEECEPGVSSSG